MPPDGSSRTGGHRTLVRGDKPRSTRSALDSPRPIVMRWQLPIGTTTDRSALASMSRHRDRHRETPGPLDVVEVARVLPRSGLAQSRTPAADAAVGFGASWIARRWRD